MIDSRIIEQVMLDQREELRAKAKNHFVERREEQLVELDSTQAQVVIGVRRSGKSTLCYNVLSKANVAFAYINFDDERLYHLTGDDLNSVLEVAYKVYGQFTHLFIDEIQNIAEWYLFVNRLLRRGLHVLITGSNAKLLSGELATHLTGRNQVTRLYPFSFEDYCRWRNLSTNGRSTQDVGLLRGAFDDYLHTGGFPELLQSRNPRRYVSGMFDNIVERDIVERFRIVRRDDFRLLAEHVLNVVPAVVNETALQRMFNFGSPHTVKNYIGYMQQAYLVTALHKYSTKSRLRLTGRKLYPIDVAFMGNRPDAFSAPNVGWRLETMVYIELLRQAAALNTDVYYYDATRTECDFMVCRGSQVLSAIQVCYNISAPATRRRELAGLLAAANATGCKQLWLLTDDAYEDLEVEGRQVKVRPVWQWVLSSAAGIYS